ncbi:sphingolipid C9-methyltransferase [Auricularia subglabra TFB-10046 SS5]|uniref:sphingolipid C(9)-methyltransferase n=1 Tax=Auricularia subglabra (strain TFB-10046 / SS5) TaxID=717982 RepID=J0CXH4_AURST|nr:sphingolipid C9-methyltransferase [Auricularia subglabra TFB-10046 SS5]
MVKPTTTPAIKNAPLEGLAEGNGSFSNIHLAALVLGVPYLIKRALPLVNRGGFWTYLFVLAVTGVPVAVGYWWVMSRIGGRKNDKVKLPGRPITDYIEFKDSELADLYKSTGKKIPIQVAYDAYFDGKIELKGDVLDVLEMRHDWASFEFTLELFKYVFTVLIPDVLFHTREQDEQQVRGHYDRGNDFYEWFLGPRMVYTSGVIKDLSRQESLEELQDNKLELVCQKLGLNAEDRMLDIGCGWGTLVTHAAKNYGADVTGVTLSKEQAKFCNDRIANNGVAADKARVKCIDYRDIPAGQTFTKISCLEMAEHVGIRRYPTFLRQLYDLLDDDGLVVFQVAGIRPPWQYEDLNWGLFMNKYVFPGADASCSLGWVINQLEGAGFEMKNVDVLGVHYSATLYRWYLNWLKNKENVEGKYGKRWFRVWSFFLAWATIASRQGGASVFQITMHKNLNAFHRVEGVPTHFSLFTGKESFEPVV